MQNWIQTVIGQRLAELLCGMATVITERLDEKEYVIECNPEAVASVLQEELEKGAHFVNKFENGQEIILIMKGGR